MPFYEYECQNCKFYSEVMQRISDPPLKKCPSCGRNTMKKLISAPNFRLKGGGWYETDFKSDQESKRNLAESDKGEKAEKDSKPAAEASGKTAETPAAKESKPSETKTASGTAGSRRSVAISRTPARGEPRRSAAPAAKAAASHRGAGRRPGAAKASRSSKAARPARGKSRR